MLEKVLLEVQAVHPDSVWVVGDFPSDPCTLPAVDPSLRHLQRHSERYNSNSMSNINCINISLTSCSKGSAAMVDPCLMAIFWSGEFSAVGLCITSIF